jgi:hypothetical protein
MSCGICVGQSGTGAGFLRVLRFPLPTIIPQNSPSSLSPEAGTVVGQLVVDVPSGPSLTPPPTIRMIYYDRVEETSATRSILYILRKLSNINGAILLFNYLENHQTQGKIMLSMKRVYYSLQLLI